MKKFKVVLKYVFGLFFVGAGLNHFVRPDFYLRMMPSYLPWHGLLVMLSGVCEVVLGGLLLIRRFERVAAWGLIVLLVAVVPANVQMATHPELYEEFNAAALWLRLPLQGVLLAWAYWYTRADARR